MTNHKLLRSLICVVSTMFLLCFKSFMFSPCRTIDITNKKVKFMGGCHYNVMVIEDGEKRLFFKECKKKTSIREEVDGIIDDYFSEVSPVGNYLPERNLIVKALSNKNNLNKFIHMGVDFNVGTVLSDVLYRRRSLAAIGFSAVPRYGLKMDLNKFLRYASRDIHQYFANSGVKLGEYEDRPARAAVASYRMAEILDVPNLIVKTEYVELTRHGKRSKRGFLMDEAKDINSHFVRNRNGRRLTPSFHMQVTDLQVLDAICMQVDHAPGNYCVLLNGKEIVGLNAFDNDDSFFLDTNLHHGFWHAKSAILTPSGKINLPHMSEKLAKNILKLTDSYLKEQFSQILTNSQLNAMINRVHQIKAAIQKTMTTNKNFLIGDGKWNNKAMRDEYYGRYVSTYFKSFCKCANVKPV